MRFHSGSGWSILVVTAILIFFAYIGICHAQNGQAPEAKAPDFTKFSLEELKNVEIVSASKKPAKVSDVAAAVFVITQEDIRRSGATNIPDILRLATGVHVARITTTDWAVNIRGLNNRFAQNLLVLIDGRSVYTHVFSGVFWDIQDTVIEDIERIEVIRGPGAALWGANAVNGVINIITKNAKDTQGGQAVVLGGNEEQSASVRYGDTLAGAPYRVYGKFFNRDKIGDVVKQIEGQTIDLSESVQQSKQWRSGRAGFRMDCLPGQGLSASSANSFTLQGEAYGNRYDKQVARQSITFPFATSTRTDISEAQGGHLLGRWKHEIAYDSETILQLSFEKAQKDYDPSSGQVYTSHVDFQHRFGLGQIQEILWGLEYRNIVDRFDNTQTVKMDPQERDLQMWSAFIQDELQLIPQQLILTAGSKFEHHEFTGLAIQPSVRALYKIHPRHTIWAAVSRAVRVPSRLEHDSHTNEYVQLPNDNSSEPAQIITDGNGDLDTEELIAYELGYRFQPVDTLWLDSTVFYNQYDKLIGFELLERNLDEDPNSYRLRYQNNRKGHASGFELTSDWQATQRWLLSGSYTYLYTEIDKIKTEDENINELLLEGSNPRLLLM
jgi:iron complex outermembrane receptor protein